MSKEIIPQQWIVNPSEAKRYGKDGKLVALHIAIEAAKQQSIGFAEWLKDNYYMDNEGFYHHDYQNKNHFNIGELYTIYLEQVK